MRISGTVRVPGDKSISHRALILAALAEGTTRIRGILESADVQSTAGVLRALGVEVPALGPDISIRGVGRRGLRQPTSRLDCGNSGTTARLMAGVIAGSGLSATFVGDESLSRRPMRRVARPLAAMGASIELPSHDGLPMTVRGAVLESLDWRTEHASAQVKSAILLAGLVSGTVVSVEEPIRSRDHTERMLAALGAPVTVDGATVKLGRVRELKAVDLEVPGDPSSAAFLAALAALSQTGSLEIEGMLANPTRTGFFTALRRMGAGVELEREQRAGETVATVTVRPDFLRAIDVTPEDVPSMIDELPLLACVAALADGETRIRGAAELRVKESDRIAAVVANLQAVGVEAREFPDGLAVIGRRGPLSGRVVTHGDHRLAMAFGVLGALPGSAIEIDDPDCVAVSFPNFWSILERVRG
jgi:3-phosphoshikimate 1-carboxyvinyltransferase